MTDQELIDGCIRDKQHHQKLLFDRYAGRMMSVCNRYAKDEQQAKDILQEGFIRLFKVIGQYRNEGSFEGWMRRIFSSVALRQISKEKIKFSELSLVAEDDFTVEPSVIAQMDESEIMALIKTMPDGYRLVFNLVAIEGYSHEEVAKMLGIQSTTSRGQFLRARKFLQHAILKNLKTILV